MSELFGWLPARSAAGECLDVARRVARHTSPWQVSSPASVSPAITIGRRWLADSEPAEDAAASPDGLVHAWGAGTMVKVPGSRRGARTCAPLALDAYLTRGVDGLTALDGEFIVCVWDARSRELFLVNDRFGLHQHFYAHGSGGFAFAPTIRALLEVPGVTRCADQVAIAQYLRFQQLLGARTWLRDVAVLPPASVLRYAPDTGALAVTRYWNWEALEAPRAASFDDAVAGCVEVFQRAVDARMIGERTGVFLSGGLDGRTLLAFIDRRVPTFTFGARECRDVAIAARLARAAGSDHHWYPLDDGGWVLRHAADHLAATEGLHSWMHAHGVSALPDARRFADVTLSGWDGGTILGGSINFYDDARFRQADEEGLARAFYAGFCEEFTWPGLDAGQAARLLDTPAGRPLLPLAEASMRAELEATKHIPARLRGDAFYIEQVLRRSLSNQVALARTALGVACPYFDATLIEFLFQLPEAIRTSPMFRRAVLARRQPRLASIPHEKDLRIPHPSAARVRAFALAQDGLQWLRRRGLPVGLPDARLYADYENYLRHELRPWAERLLFDERTLSRGFYDPAALRALWARHVDGAALHTIGTIAPLMAIEMSLRYLVDGDAADRACALDVPGTGPDAEADARRAGR